MRTGLALVLGAAIMVMCEVAHAQRVAPAREGYAVRLEDLRRAIEEQEHERQWHAAARAALEASPRVVVVDDDAVSWDAISFRVLLDGVEVFSTSAGPGLRHTRVDIGWVSPGAHVVTIERNYRGSGYGVFSYVAGYVMHTRSSHSFAVGLRESLELRAVHRDAVLCDERVRVSFREGRSPRRDGHPAA